MSKGYKWIWMKISGNVHNGTWDRWVDPGGTSKGSKPIVFDHEATFCVMKPFTITAFTLYVLFRASGLRCSKLTVIKNPSFEGFFITAGWSPLIERFPAYWLYEGYAPSSRCDVALMGFRWTVAFSVWLRYTCSVNVDLMVQITLFPKEWEREWEWESHIDFPDFDRLSVGSMKWHLGREKSYFLSPPIFCFLPCSFDKCFN